MPKTHLRQSPHWANYMQTLQWHTHHINQNIALSRNIPLLNKSIIKISRPTHPLESSAINQLAQETNALSIILEPPQHDISNQSLMQDGFMISKTAYAQSATMHIDLTVSEDQIFNNLSENARRQIRKAQKNNVIIETVPMQDFINPKSPTFDFCLLTFDLFWSLWENLCNMKHFYKLSKPEMYNRMTALASISYLMFAYNHADQNFIFNSSFLNSSKEVSAPSTPIACVWYCLYDGVIYYLHTGITQQGYDLAANYLLVWEGIKLGKQHNCTTFDFEGLYDHRLPVQTKRWKGFSEFKSRFHGQEIYFPLPLIKTYNPIFKAFFHLGEFLSPA